MARLQRCGTQSRGGSLAGRHYVAPWRRRERGGVTAKGSLVPRLHLPNVWEVESGNEASHVMMTYSDDVIAHHHRTV